jgi:probable phosphoglycerate mutase
MRDPLGEPMTKPLLIYVRHGETDWNRERRMQGQRDIPLNDKGRRQARVNGTRLKVWLDRQGIDTASFDFVASPLSRATETMELIRAALGLESTGYRLDDRLRELTFGAWEGYTLGELARVDPLAVERRKADRWGTVPPGGESYAMLRERVAPWYAELDRPTLTVAHGGVWRALRLIIAGEAREDDNATSLDVPQDRFCVIRDGVPEWM